MHSKPSPGTIRLLYWVFSAFISFLIALCGYLYFFQSPLLAKREFLLPFFLFVFLTPLVYLSLTRFLLPRLCEYSPKARRNWIPLSIGVGILFTLVTRPPQVLLLLPVHHLQIIVPAGSAERTVTLEYAKTSLREIGFGEYMQEGEWKRTETGFTHTGGEPASLTWSGRSGETAMLVLSNTPGIESVRAGWDGDLASLVPTDSSSAPIIVASKFNVGWMSVTFSRLVTGLVFGILFLVLTLLLAGVQLKSAPAVKRKRGYWLIYALPMAAVWGIYLLAFFPGMMSTDSAIQWKQVISGKFNDLHPVFHTLFIWLITRLWFSPATVALFQILSLSLTIGWGISILDEQGLPTWASWILAVIFAVSPVNAGLVITIWKDIPFSTCLLLLSLLILKVVFSNGEFLKRDIPGSGLEL